MNEEQKRARARRRKVRLLVRVVERLIRHSKNADAAGFSAEEWVRDWLRHPLPGDSRLASDVLDDRDGLSQVMAALLRQQTQAAYF